jgi:hypothetical protein
MSAHLSARVVTGWFFLAAAVVFLTINSNILARAAARWADDYWDKISYGAIAAFVPWIIAVTPFVVVWAWKTQHRVWSLVGSVVYVLFILYNLLGAGGAIAVVRTDAISAKVHGFKTERRTEDLREALVNRRDAIAKTTRPARQLASMLDAERAKPLWEETTRCTAPETKKEQRYCAEYYKLATEHGAAQELAQISERIAELDMRSIERGPVAQQVDPQAAFIARWAGVAGFEWPVERIGEMIPLATPTVLEIGSMTLAAWGILLLGFNHSIFASGTPAVPVKGGELSPQPALLPPPPQMQFVAEWFAEHVRPVNSGSLAEEAWYSLYCRECSRSGVVPVPIEVFREAAEKHGAKVTEVDGKHYYQRILPRIAA